MCMPRPVWRLEEEEEKLHENTRVGMGNGKGKEVGGTRGQWGGKCAPNTSYACTKMP